MAITVNNWLNDNRKVIAEKGMFKVVEHQRDLSVGSATAQNAYFASEMNVRLRQVEISLDGTQSVKTQAGAMQMILGNVEMATGVTSAKGFLGSMVKAAVTNETAVKPEYDLEEKENPCSKGYIKRWTDLGDIWGLCAQKCGEPNLFMLALHRIHWGIYPKNFPERIPIEMVEYLERALLQDNECNKGWKKNDYYRDAFDDVVNQGCPVGDHMLRYRSSWYCRYISNRTWLTVVYKGREAPTIDLSNYTRAEFVSAKKQASVFAEYHAYVKVVTTLIPEAAKWDSAQWLNERFLYRQLKHRFGISARDLDECWDPTVSFLIDLWYYKKISVEKLLRIKRIL